MKGRVLFDGLRPLGPPRRRALKAVLTRMLEEHGQDRGVTVVFLGERDMRRLHSRHLGIDEPTDVLSFSLGEDDGPSSEPLLGEVYVCIDVAEREAARRRLSRDHELCLYAIHGLLHLLGYDDRDPLARRRMRRRERKYLESLSDRLDARA